MEEPMQQEAPAYTKLSTILARFPADQQHQVHLLLRRQIRRGQLHGVSTLDWVLIPRQGKSLRVSELLINLALETWTRHVLAEFFGVSKVTGRVKTEQDFLP